ncbi:hypothetical protein DDJ31_12085 [Streptomyces griseoviridis]|nr:hypothetical protein DDJ31_12085 [Streptomyces griseoviridis]
MVTSRERAACDALFGISYHARVLERDRREEALSRQWAGGRPPGGERAEGREGAGSPDGRDVLGERREPGGRSPRMT